LWITIDFFNLSLTNYCLIIERIPIGAVEKIAKQVDVRFAGMYYKKIEI